METWKYDLCGLKNEKGTRRVGYLIAFENAEGDCETIGKGEDIKAERNIHF